MAEILLAQDEYGTNPEQQINHPASALFRYFWDLRGLRGTQLTTIFFRDERTETVCNLQRIEIFHLFSNGGDALGWGCWGSLILQGGRDFLL